MAINKLIYGALLLAILFAGCNKDSSPGQVVVPKKNTYYIKLTMDGKTYEFGYDSTVCQYDPPNCDTTAVDSAHLDSYAFIDGVATDYRLAVDRDILEDSSELTSLDVKAYWNPANPLKCINLNFLIDYKLGEHAADVYGQIGPNRVEMTSPDNTDNTQLHVTLYKAGERGSVVEGTFAGQVYQYESDTEARKVDIAGEFKVLRTH